MTEERAEEQWIIKVNGTEQANVKPGERLEIGRKPIRPLADDGYRRMEIADRTRSISKRHALFSVDSAGNALVRDLSSTNGSYVVRTNGNLVRLQPGEDIPFTGSPVRLQFGDVPMDFIRVELPQDEPKQAVPGLFAYATNGEKQEPDPSAMSVDDILDLRAGEPTSVFNTRTVSDRINQLRQAAEALNSAQEQEMDSGDSRKVNIDAARQDESKPISEIAMVNETVRELSEKADEPAKQEQPAEQISLNIIPPTGKQAPPRDLFADALNTGDHATDSVRTQGALVSEQFPTSQGEASPNRPQRSSMEQGSEEVHNTGDEVRRLAEKEPEDIPDSQSNHEFLPEQTTVFKPVFEPGSVFDRVSKGEFDKQVDQITIDGFTSGQAKTSEEFSEQFAMAQHPELLPFLAMNSTLYDDLFAWLSAQGDRDIDAALANNTGYEEYRRAVGSEPDND